MALRVIRRFVLPALLIFLVSYFVPQGATFAQARGACESLWVDASLRSDLPSGVPLLDKGPGFLVPNETHGGRLGPKLAHTPSGLYVTTGTERGLMTSALLPENPKGLVLVDRDPKVVFFNLMNRALLALARNRQDYLELRLRGNFETVSERLRTEGAEISNENSRLLKDPAAWRWWKEAVQASSAWESFHRDPSLNPDRSYAGANYLFSDKLFARVSDLAKRDVIYVWQLDMKSEEFKKRLRVIGGEVRAQVSLVDLSNAWQEGYIGYKATIELFAFLETLISPKASLVFTYMAKDSAGSGETIFEYSVMAREELRSWNDLQMLFVGLDRQDPSRVPYQRVRYSRMSDDY